MDAFIGEIRAFPYGFIPQDWEPCEGQKLSIPGFPRLYAVIGQTYGGDGKSYFNVPELRGRVAVGTDTRDVNFFRNGIGGGVNSVALNVDQIPSHVHEIKAFSHNLAQNDVVTNQPGPTAYLTNTTTKPASGNPKGIRTYSNGPLSGSDASLNAATLGLTGEGLPHDNRQPYLTFCYCICTYSDFFPVNPN
jgi:microcystin-dependent protein